MHHIHLYNFNNNSDKIFSDYYIMNSDKFWYDDFSILFDNNRLIEFIPTDDMTREEKFNSLVRMSLYLSIILMISKNNYLYFYIFLSVLFLTYLLFIFNDKSKEKENFKDSSKKTLTDIDDVNKAETINTKDCRKPTNNNPFMNVLLTDDYSKVNKGCVYNDDIKKDIDEKFYRDIFDDVSNLYGRRTGQRNFYSMPSTTVPNDQQSFANWCYKVPKTCKEGNLNSCYKNLYNRLPNLSESGSHAGARHV